MALGQEYTYGLYSPARGRRGWTRELLQMQGFAPVPQSCGSAALAVDSVAAHHPQQQRGHHHQAAPVHGTGSGGRWRRFTGGRRAP